MLARLRRRRTWDALFVLVRGFGVTRFVSGVFPVATSFEMQAVPAPQDEVCLTLVVRSAATLRVSNHEAVNSRTSVLSHGRCLLWDRLCARATHPRQQFGGRPGVCEHAVFYLHGLHRAAA